MASVLDTSLLWNNKDHKWILKCSGILLIFFIIYRFGNYWQYVSPYVLGNIYLKYIDLTAISVVILFSRHGYLLCAKRQEQEPGNNAQLGFVEDNCIDDQKDDTYERSQIAEQIANQILATKNKRSFAIGITGVYGSGKTSFINLITNIISQTWKHIQVFRINS